MNIRTCLAGSKNGSQRNRSCHSEDGHFKTEPSSGDRQTEKLKKESARLADRLELATGVGLAEAPAGRRHIGRGDGPVVARGDPERQWLAVEHSTVLPVGTPVVAHGQPPCLGRLHPHCLQVTGAGNIGYEHQVEVGVAGDGEPDATLLDTSHSSVLYGHDAGTELGDLCEHGLGHVEVRLRWVAPPAVIVGEPVVGRAEVGGRYDHGAR